MEGRFGRLLERFKRKPQEEPVTITIYIPEEMTPEEYEEMPPKARLMWGERVRASEIRQPDTLEDLFTPEPEVITIGQTTLPWNGIEDMEIYQTRTMNDSIVSRLLRNRTREQIEEDLEEMRLFLAGKSKTVTES